METYAEAIARARREYLMRVMEIANGDIQSAAKISGKHRGDFYKALKKYAPDARRIVRKPMWEGNAAWQALQD